MCVYCLCSYNNVSRKRSSLALMVLENLLLFLCLFTALTFHQEKLLNTITLNVRKKEVCFKCSVILLTLSEHTASRPVVINHLDVAVMGVADEDAVSRLSVIEGQSDDVFEILGVLV